MDMEVNDRKDNRLLSELIDLKLNQKGESPVEEVYL